MLFLFTCMRSQKFTVISVCPLEPVFICSLHNPVAFGEKSVPGAVVSHSPPCTQITLPLNDTFCYVFCLFACSYCSARRLCECVLMWTWSHGSHFQQKHPQQIKRRFHHFPSKTDTDREGKISIQSAGFLLSKEFIL